MNAAWLLLLCLEQNIFDDTPNRYKMIDKKMPLTVNNIKGITFCSWGKDQMSAFALNIINRWSNTNGLNSQGYLINRKIKSLIPFKILILSSMIHAF